MGYVANIHEVQSHTDLRSTVFYMAKLDLYLLHINFGSLIPSPRPLPKEAVVKAPSPRGRATVLKIKLIFHG